MPSLSENFHAQSDTVSILERIAEAPSGCMVDMHLREYVRSFRHAGATLSDAQRDQIVLAIDHRVKRGLDNDPHGMWQDWSGTQGDNEPLLRGLGANSPVEIARKARHEAELREETLRAAALREAQPSIRIAA
jgi:hypothetical protein